MGVGLEDAPSPDGWGSLPQEVPWQGGKGPFRSGCMMASAGSSGTHRSVGGFPQSGAGQQAGVVDAPAGQARGSGRDGGT